MGTAADADPLAGTTDILVKTLRALGEAGQADAASRYAARAWWLLRDGRPREAERINGAMHYLARLLEDSPATPTAQEAT